jgi:mono/diheme cytochrome c family protein
MLNVADNGPQRRGANLKIACLLVLSLCSCWTVAAAVDQDTHASALTSNSIYQKSCAKCHGNSAAGRHFGGPSLISEKISSASIDELRTIINQGKGRMPKFAGKLPPADVDQLLMQIKGANQK